MHVVPITKQNRWDAFVTKHAPASGAFLHSWSWGELQKKESFAIERLGVFEEETLVAVALFVQTPLPLFGFYFYTPRGPIVVDPSRMIDVLCALHCFAKEKDALFLRIEPATLNESSVKDTFSIKQTHPIQAKDTLLFDLRTDPETWLSSMHTKTRYNIRLAQKKSLDLSLCATPTEGVWDLFKETAQRGEFRLHTISHYRALLACVDDAHLATASYKGELVCAVLYIDFGHTRTYVHGASSHTHRNLMAPYLLHYELLKDAKAHGLQFYDWWGVASTKNPAHPWAGFSRFKWGFGGSSLSLPGTFDLLVRPVRYRLYQTLRRLRRALPL